MHRSINDTDNFVAFIQLHDGSYMAGCILGATVEEVKSLIKEDVYSITTWQLHPDTVYIYEIKREANGYPHTGALVHKSSSTEYLNS